ncbi:hypothetical protein Q7P37_007809 [Cladosporium fusiforme]
MDKAPLHRRASWGKNPQSYDAYMRNDLAKIRSPTSSQDYGLGNFSYDNKYLSDWAMPEAIKHEHLPKQIFDKADDWSAAGAALDTALERIDHLRVEAIYRGWPDKKHAHLARPHWPSPTGPGAQFHAPFPEKPSTLPRPTTTKGNGIPPFTPLNAPTTPANPTEGNAATLPDLSKINTQLSPSSSTSPVSPPTSTPTAPTFDEPAWQTYTNQFLAELHDLRGNALGRFKGTARDVDTLQAEYEHTAEYAGVFKMFRLWWEGQRGKVKLYEERVRGLEVPSEAEARRERVGAGLGV